MAAEGQVITAAVAKLSELQDGQMKEVEVGEGKILVIKDKNKVFATGNRCTHYGAPLKTGAYCNGRIRCPWHGACFSTSTGDIEDFPGMDNIHVFPVEIRGDDVIVSVPTRALTETKRPPKTCGKSPEDNRLFVVVGGGPAGASCAETLRSQGFTGRVVMICKEKVLPYDRPKLSKAMNTSADRILLRQPEWYQQNQIEVLLGKEAVEVDATTKQIRLNDGTEFRYDCAFVAPGGFPRTIPVPGMDLGNIFPLRDPADANHIIENVEGKRVVIVGTSFIGMEVASCIAKKARSVIAVGMESVPFERVLGEQLGSVLRKLHDSNGVSFRMKRVVREFRGVDGKVRSVLLDNGEQLDADMCVVGAGIIPNTKFIKNVKNERDGSVVCDEYLKAADGLYAGGDICRFPFYLNGEMIRIEHYGMAHYHGALAAKNMLGQQVPATSVPFFWTTQYGKSIRYAGHCMSYDELYLQGNPDELAFVGFYCKNDKVIAAVSMNKDPIVSAVAELLHNKRMPSLSELKAGNIDLVRLAGSI